MRGIEGMFLGLIFGILTSLVIIDKSDIAANFTSIVNQPIYLFIIFFTALFGWFFAQMITTKKQADTKPSAQIQLDPDMVVAVSSIFAGLILALKTGKNYVTLIPAVFLVVWFLPRLIPVWQEHIKKNNIQNQTPQSQQLQTGGPSGTNQSGAANGNQ